MKKYMILIVCFTFSLEICIVLVYSHNIDKLTYSNTIEYSATVKEIVKTDTGNKMSVRIYIDNYLSYILISPRLTEKINPVAFENIETNDIITFRIEKKKEIHINTAEFLDIVYLATDDNVILSLDDYNRYTKESADNTRIAGIIFILLLNTIAALLFIRAKKQKIKNQESVL